MADEWKGENPFYLMIRHAQESDGVIVNSIIDLDEEGWSQTYAHLMRIPGRWYLIRKETSIITLAMVVKEGEQPYYKARHIGMGSMVGEEVEQSEVIAYGLGRKLVDGHVERMWHFPDGPVTVIGDDVNDIGRELLPVVNAHRKAQKEMQRQFEEMMSQQGLAEHVIEQ